MLLVMMMMSKKKGRKREAEKGWFLGLKVCTHSFVIDFIIPGVGFVIKKPMP